MTNSRVFEAAERRPPPDLSTLAPRLTTVIVSVVLSGLSLIAFLNTVTVEPGLGRLLLCLICVGAMLWLQLVHFTRLAPLMRSNWRIPLLLLQAVVAFAPLLVLGQTWVGMAGFLAGNVLLVLGDPGSWVAFGTVVAGMAGVQYAFTPSAPEIVYTAVSTGLTGLIVYGLSRLTDMVAEVHRTRLALAESAVAAERLRFSRDLHDLLGYSLSAIALKGELAGRLMDHSQDRAADELDGIVEISRQALADVRSVASQYREMSLDAEARSARSVLAAANIEVSVVVVHGSLTAQVNTVLATVLREGVTNVLGHSKAEHCDITVRQEKGSVQITICNDGVRPEPAEPPARQGLGVQSLSARVAALGGHLNCGLLPDGRFRLHAEIPVKQSAEPKPEGRSGQGLLSAG